MRRLAIMPVSLYGQTSNMRSICDLADRYSLLLLRMRPRALEPPTMGLVVADFL